MKQNNKQEHKIAAESEHTSQEVNPVGARKAPVLSSTITINGAETALYLQARLLLCDLHFFPY